MKILTKHSPKLTSIRLQLTCITLLFLYAGCHQVPDYIPTLHVTPVTWGLVAPMGLETDANGNIWVAETGTAANDGKVVIVKPTGETYDAIINLSSIHNAASGEVEGPAHMLRDNNILYVLAGNYLYSINIAGFMPGDTPIDASTLSYEDIGSFSLSYPYVNDADDTHPYNLTKGPDGDLYIADAGANAIIHRKGPGSYTVLAEIPGIANPLPFGPPQVQGVPTSIMYDGRDFLVSTLTGFPFPTGYARVYKVSMSGNVSLYQNGFTCLTDMAQGNFLGHLVLQYATFGAKGFEPNTGALIWATGKNMRPVINKLNMPVGLKQVNARTWYISSMGDGAVLKAAFY